MAYLFLLACVILSPLLRVPYLAAIRSANSTPKEEKEVELEVEKEVEIEEEVEKEVEEGVRGGDGGRR